MLQTSRIPIEQIYVPGKLKRALDAARVETMAEALMDEGPVKPIQVRQGKGRYVLVQGLNRLEAAKALGEEAIDAMIVQARRS